MQKKQTKIAVRKQKRLPAALLPGNRSEQERRASLIRKYRRRALRLSKVMSLEEKEAEEMLREAPVQKRHLPEQDLQAYFKAGPRERRLYYRSCSRALGHRLERLPKEQRALLLCRFRDRLDWKTACKKAAYTKSGAMKVLKKLREPG